MKGRVLKGSPCDWEFCFDSGGITQLLALLDFNCLLSILSNSIHRQFRYSTLFFCLLKKANLRKPKGSSCLTHSSLTTFHSGALGLGNGWWVWDGPSQSNTSFCFRWSKAANNGHMASSHNCTRHTQTLPCGSDSEFPLKSHSASLRLKISKLLLTANV